MVEILIVCGIKNYDTHHENIINVINKIINPINISKELCNFYTLQTINNFYNEDVPADLFISSFDNDLFIFNKSFEEIIFEGDQDERNSSIKEFNIQHNNKFDYIILEHCPIFNSSIIIPEFVKHYNMLKPNGYFIIFSSGNLTSDFQFIENYNFPILDKIFNRINNNIYKKMNDNVYNMEICCKNYGEYSKNYIPLPIYELSSKQKYLKYKKKYFDLRSESI